MFFKNKINDIVIVDAITYIFQRRNTDVLMCSAAWTMHKHMFHCKHKVPCVSFLSGNNHMLIIWQLAILLFCEKFAGLYDTIGITDVRDRVIQIGNPACHGKFRERILMCMRISPPLQLSRD